MLVCVALLSLAGVRQALPETASVLYTGIPFCAGSSDVRMVSHSAIGQVSKTEMSFESTSLLKNDSDKPQQVILLLPVAGQNVAWDMLQKHRISATLDKFALKTVLQQVVKADAKDAKAKTSGVVYGTYISTHEATVTFKPNETRALRVIYRASIGRAGLDGLQRMVVYETAGAHQWRGNVGQFNLSIKYDPQLVFQVFSRLPNTWPWQVGPRGAFVKRTDFEPDTPSLAIFTYYPGGFDKIGG